MKGKDYNEWNVVKLIVIVCKEEDVKKGNLVGDRKWFMGVKIEEGKDVRVRSVIKIELVIVISNLIFKNVCIWLKVGKKIILFFRFLGFRV